jgi:hypothetical protein
MKTTICHRSYLIHIVNADDESRTLCGARLPKYNPNGWWSPPKEEKGIVEISCRACLRIARGKKAERIVRDE